MKSFFDTIKFTGTDAIKLAGLIITGCTLWFANKQNNDEHFAELSMQIKEINIYKDADAKVMESRIVNIEVAQIDAKNKINDVEKRLFRMLAIMPNKKREEE